MVKQKIGKANSIIKNLRKQIRKNEDKNIFVVDDLLSIQVILKNKLPIDKVLYCSEIISSDLTNKILEKSKQNSKEIYEISKEVFLSLSSKKNLPGIILVVSNIEMVKENFDISKYNRILVNDGLEIPGNLGTIYRSVDATGFDLLINVDLKTSINHFKCIHSSRGMVFNIDTISLTYYETQKLLNENNIEVFLGEPKQGKSCFDTIFPKRLALVVGSERFGINKEWYTNPHKKIYIPMRGYMKSLNVSVATSIFMYQVLENSKKN